MNTATEQLSFYPNSAEEQILARQTDYVATFGGEVSKRVLDDLMSFCFIGRPYTTDEMLNMNDRMAWMIQGRQEVGLRILQHLKLSQEEIFKLYSGKGRIR